MMKPIGDKIVVKRAEAPKESEGGIVIPTTAQEQPKEGVVVAVGPGKLNDKGERIPMQIKVGDTVMFASFSGTNARYEGVDYLVMLEDDVIAVLE
jgi:chaperonin GroES